MVLKIHSTSRPAVRINNELLNNRIGTVVHVSLMEQYRHLCETGRIANFEKVIGTKTGTHEGYYFNDSDVYKWLEAVAYAQKYKDIEDLTRAARETIQLVARAQQSNGYLNTFFQLKHPDLRWRNTMMMHEMYCLGHLIEAGVAWAEESLDRETDLLLVALKAAEEFSLHFGPHKKKAYPGHEELELALFRLADVTQDQKWANLAGWMIDSRGERPSPFEKELKDLDAASLSPWAEKLLCKEGKYSGEYLQDHRPITQHDSMVGHAVRAVYLYNAATEWAIRRPNQNLSDALKRIWKNLVDRRIYITGGIGPSGDNEGFTSDYDLPNLTAYAESCAACGLFWWASKMVDLTGDPQYTRFMEVVLMNNILAGISEDGKSYFYDNPLESRGQHLRSEWFTCACCPPNIARTLLSLDRHVATVSNDSIAIKLLIDASISVQIQGEPVTIEVKSGYPWNRNATVHVACSANTRFELKMALPVGCSSVRFSLPDQLETRQTDDGWLIIDGVWGETTDIEMDVHRPPVWKRAHPLVLDNLGKVALQIGPIVYCAETDSITVDPDEVTFRPIYPQHLRMAIQEPLEFVPDSNLPVVYAYGIAFCDVPEASNPPPDALMPFTVVDSDEDGPDALYPAISFMDLPVARVRLIPYFMWNNKGRTHMTVWFRVDDSEDDGSIVYN